MAYMLEMGLISKTFFSNPITFSKINNVIEQWKDEVDRRKANARKQSKLERNNYEILEQYGKGT